MRVIYFAFTFTILTLFQLSIAGPLAAQSSSEKEWAKGVSDENKGKATELLEEGNKLLLAKQNRQALDKYQEAIEHWDHPAIRFNIAKIFIELERPLDASNNIDKALAYGSAPLEDEVFREAQNYAKLLKGQIAEIEVSCSQKEVSITLDGKSFLQCPGKKKERTLPGKHQVVGKKQGFLTSTEEIVVLPNQENSLRVSLVSLNSATKKVKRWNTWKPWAVTGGGLAVMSAGLLFRQQSKSSFNEYDNAIASNCAGVGCTNDESANPNAMPLSQATQDLKNSGETKNTLGATALAVGGTVTIMGAVLLYLNRSRTVVDYKEKATSFAPVSPNGSLGFTVLSRF